MTTVFDEPEDLNVVTIPYEPRHWQYEAHNNLKQFNVIVVHRRAGKTEFAINELIKRALMNGNCNYAYIAPTYKQVKKIAWARLKHYSGFVHGTTVSESEMSVTFPNKSKISLWGAHNPDAIRGEGFDGVVLDETQDLPEILWDEILLPTLFGRKNWFIIVLGTPKGRNLFFNLYEKGLKSPKKWYTTLLTVKDTMFELTEDYKTISAQQSEEKNRQEWHCDFMSAANGSYYHKYIVQARAEGRISDKVEWEPEFPVYTAWDIGIRDLTCIWFWQKIGGKFYFIDYMQDNDKSLKDWIQIVNALPYEYERHYAPHDMAHREFTSGSTRQAFAQEQGLNFTITPRRSIEDGIEASRVLLPESYFNETNCAPGIVALENYKAKTDRRSGRVYDEPEHDEYSHGADAFRYSAINVQELDLSFSQSSIYG